ncbi:hypothetical protein PWT90_07811 [Aphanocladium album]|nr:hypothetical protein PWT90_07811 [Aphanocladium album]
MRQQAELLLRRVVQLRESIDQDAVARISKTQNQQRIGLDSENFSELADAQTLSSELFRRDILQLEQTVHVTRTSSMAAESKNLILAQCYRLLSQAYKKAGRLEESIETATSLLDLDEGAANALLSSAWLEKGDVINAFDAAVSSIELFLNTKLSMHTFRNLGLPCMVFGLILDEAPLDGKCQSCVRFCNARQAAQWWQEASNWVALAHSDDDAQLLSAEMSNSAEMSKLEANLHLMQLSKADACPFWHRLARYLGCGISNTLGPVLSEKELGMAISHLLERIPANLPEQRQQIETLADRFSEYQNANSG